MYAESHPQYEYSDEVENIYALPEFKEYHDQLNINDFIYLEVMDDEYVKLRVTEISYNPCDMDESMELTFTSPTTYKTKRNDFNMKLKEEGADLIVCTGGMSVDPDDKTPGAIKNTGARIVSYGAPVLPGAMFLLSYLEDGTPVMGLPGCVMYAKATVFDLVLPRIIAGIEVTKKDLAHMGNGGFCLGCKECHYPNCSFGKGV